METAALSPQDHGSCCHFRCSLERWLFWPSSDNGPQLGAQIVLRFYLGFCVKIKYLSPHDESLGVGMVRSIVHAPASRFIPLIRWNAKKQAIRESIEPAFDLGSQKIPPELDRQEDLVRENFNLRTHFELMTLRIVRRCSKCN